jgi:acyl-CoA thioesterase-1
MRSLMLSLSAFAMFIGLSGCSSVLDSCGAPPGAWAYTGVGMPMPQLGTVPVGLRIVTLGSSSTAGVGASLPSRTYPEQLQRVLDRRFPDQRVEVINRGVAGEVVSNNLARLNRDVFTLAPDLVIWQVGTNDTIYVRDLVTVLEQVQMGIDRIQASGAKLAIMSSQPFSDAAREVPTVEMNEALRRIAQKNNLPFLDRHALMSWWIDSGTLYRDEVIGGDELHMTDRSYECLAIRVADVVPGLAEGIVPRDRPTAPLPPFDPNL